MKNAFKKIVVAINWHYVKILLKKHNIIVIGVAGSIGKTGTKRAIATTLSQKYKVRWQDGNYNDLVSVPLIFFGLSMPSLMNPVAWIKVFRKMKHEIKSYNYEAVVIEIGTDGPGQIALFEKYITLDIGVITRIAPEHMEFFADIEAVATEEITLQNYSKSLIVHEQIRAEYGSILYKESETFGILKSSTSRFKAEGTKITIQIADQKFSVATKLHGEHQMWSLSAAALVGNNLGMTNEQIIKGLENVTPAPGRMQILNGINKSTLIDDTYNASAEAMMAALDTLCSIESKQRIAVLGNMNEMGELSEGVHAKVGDYVDAKKIHTVLTIGKDANKYLAAHAEKNGITVFRYDTPGQVGLKLKEIVQDGSVVLMKGSQNGVFLEEAIKPILKNPDDVSKLVRQSPEWLAKKSKLLAKITR